MSGSSRGRSRVPRRARRACPARRARVRIGDGPGSSRPCASGSATRVLLRLAHHPRRPGRVLVEAENDRENLRPARTARSLRRRHARRLVRVASDAERRPPSHLYTFLPLGYSSRPHAAQGLDSEEPSPLRARTEETPLRRASPFARDGHPSLRRTRGRSPPPMPCLGCQRWKTRQVLWPPKPNEFEMPISTGATRAWLAM
jgi:hypothetical protein